MNKVRMLRAVYVYMYMSMISHNVVSDTYYHVLLLLLVMEWVNYPYLYICRHEIEMFLCLWRMTYVPLLPAWKLSNGEIRSICATNFERGKIIRSSLIRSTAWRNANSWLSSTGWNKPPFFMFFFLFFFC